MNRAMPPRTHLTVGGSPNRKQKVIIATAATSDENETHRVKAIETKKTANELRATSGTLPSKAPKPVLSPYPPMNLRNGESECPTIAIIPQ